MALQEKPKKKIKVPKVVNGVETLVEIEVEDSGGPTWGANDSHTILNHDIRRVDGPEKVTGKAKYSYDIRVPGMLYGRILRSPHASAEIVSVDTSAAEKIPGVKVVLSFAGKKTLKYEGDPVAAVAAITPEIAEDGIRALKVTYKKLPHAVTPQQAIKPDAPEVFKGGGKGNVRAGEKKGDRDEAEAALKTCDAVASGEYFITTQHHVCLETHGVVVDYRGGDKAKVYASTQGTFTVPGEAAQSLGLKNEQAVECIVEYMGGGFGAKFGLDLPGDIACQLSKKAKAPVHLMLTRVDEFLMAGNRSGTWQKVQAGATKDGKLVAMIGEQYRLGGLDEGAYLPFPYIYKVEKSHRVMNSLHTNQDGARAMRAPGHPQASFPMESLVDDLAYKIGMDPVEFRKKNLDDPYYLRQLDVGAKAIDWENRPATPGGGEAYGPYKSLKRGMGCACTTWGGGGGPECEVDIFITKDGAVTVQVGTQDLGTGSRTLTAAIVAEEFGLPVETIATRIGHSTYGKANASGGSTTTASLAPAVKDAAYNAKIQLFQKVAPAVGGKAEDLVAKDGKIYAKNAPDITLTWKQACATVGMSGLSARGVWQQNLAGDGVHGAQFAEVEVDIETGHVRALKMVAVQDCGLPLNRKGIESQMNGGMILALGYALYEEHFVDALTGNMLNATMDEYKIPGCQEMPEFVTIIDDGDTRQAVVGMAETANVPGASAIANAVYSACGVRVTSLPITPDKILDGLAKLKKA